VGRQGTVVEVSSSLCRVDLDGRCVVCGLRGSLSSHDTGFTNVVAVGDHVIVGAGSVVTKSFAGSCVIAGVPAKIIRKLGNDVQHTTHFPGHFLQYAAAIKRQVDAVLQKLSPILDELYAQALFLDDGEEKAVMITADQSSGKTTVLITEEQK
jgi:hypothetical protein